MDKPVPSPPAEPYRRIPGDPIAPWFDRAKKAEAELAEAAERIRTLEADLGRYMMLANSNAAEIAASRKRERAAEHMFAMLLEAAGGTVAVTRIVQTAGHRAITRTDDPITGEIVFRIATPDSAPAGTTDDAANRSA